MRGTSAHRVLPQRLPHHTAVTAALQPRLPILQVEAPFVNPALLLRLARLYWGKTLLHNGTLHSVLPSEATLEEAEGWREGLQDICTS